MTDDSNFSADDFLSDDEDEDFAASMGMGGDTDSMFASMEDAQVLAKMGIQSGAESAGVVSNRKLAMNSGEAPPEAFHGRQARRSKVNATARPEFVVWDTESEPELTGSRHRQAKQSNKPSRKASARSSQRRQKARPTQNFRPSRVRTSARRESVNVFDEMFGTPDVSRFFEH